MDRTQQGQVSRSAADVYEEFFVPALFREPAQQIVQAANIQRGQSVLDVACGTGVLAREAAPVTGNPCNVTGLDRNDGMLAVAERLAPDINWQRGVAERDVEVGFGSNSDVTSAEGQRPLSLHQQSSRRRSIRRFRAART